MRPFPYLASLQCGVFSTEQALGAGWTRSALAHAVRAGRLRRLRSGAYQIVDMPELDPYELQRRNHAAPGIGAVLTTPGASASHSTAAVLRGLPLLFLPDRACVSVVPWHTGEIARVHVHRCTSAPETSWVGHVQCTSVERTCIDLAREHGQISGVVALDHALREGLTDRRQLAIELGRCVRWPGVRAAREAIRLADGRAESPLESRSRLLLGDYGLPRPELQVGIADHAGGFVGRVDFYWDEFRVVGEADGATKYAGADPSPLYSEKRRQDRLEEAGLLVVRWGSPDLQDFDSVVTRLRRAFARGKRLDSRDRHWTVLPDFDPARHAPGRTQRA